MSVFFVKNFDQNLGGKMNRNDRDEISGDGEYDSSSVTVDLNDNTPEELLMGFNLNPNGTYDNDLLVHDFLQEEMPEFHFKTSKVGERDMNNYSMQTLFDRIAQEKAEEEADFMDDLKNLMQIAVSNEEWATVDHLLNAARVHKVYTEVEDDEDEAFL